MFHVVWMLSCGFFPYNHLRPALMSVAMLREAHAGHQKLFNISEKQHGDFLNVSVGEVKIWGSLHTAGKVKLTRKLASFFLKECSLSSTYYNG